MDLNGMINMTNSLAAQNNAWSAQQAQKQMDFQERMSNTAHQREVADLKAAGLNPILSAKLNGASTPSGASGETDNSNVGAVVELLKEFGEGIAQASAKGYANGSNGSGSNYNDGIKRTELQALSDLKRLKEIEQIKDREEKEKAIRAYQQQKQRQINNMLTGKGNSGKTVSQRDKRMIDNWNMQSKGFPDEKDQTFILDMLSLIPGISELSSAVRLAKGAQKTVKKVKKYAST